jgi:hypothetical protein
MSVIVKPGGRSFDKKVRHMRVGEKGFVPVYALVFDLRRRAYLDLESLAFPISGINRISISRFGNGVADYRIDASRTKYTWTLKEDPYKIEDEEDFIHDSRELVLMQGVGISAHNYRFKKNKISDKDRLLKDLEYAIRAQEFELAGKIKEKINCLKGK